LWIEIAKTERFINPRSAQTPVITYLIMLEWQHIYFAITWRMQITYVKVPYNILSGGIELASLNIYGTA
jgi:hypothetical protein